MFAFNFLENYCYFYIHIYLFTKEYVLLLYSICLYAKREKELAIEDEEPVVKKKFKNEPSKKKESAEVNKYQKKKFCIKCKQNHYGECYSFKNCYICGQPGHIGKECTSKPRLCYGCGGAGHIHSLCPNGPKHEKKGKGSGPPKK